jgi:hypothetical protein
MRFFLVALDPGTGAVRLIKEGTYAQRQDALDVLGPAVDDDSSLATSDLFLVDLDQIAPVVLYRPAAPAVPLEEPLADAWIAPAYEVAADAAIEEAVLEGPEPLWVPDETLVPAVSDHEDLADALRRAAERMESEGVVAPPSVEEFAAQGSSEPSLAAVPTEGVPAADLLADPEPWPWESAASEGAGPVAAEETAAAEATIETGTDGPVVAALELESVLAIDSPSSLEAGAAEQPGIFEPVGIDEPGLEDVQLLTPVGDLSSHPLIMGEYAPDAETDVDDLTLSELEALAASLEASVGPTDATVEVEAVPVAEADKAEASDGASTEEKAYEPGGLDIAAYTCDDCVYVETCPKARQEGPATCGSFQWKSV